MSFYVFSTALARCSSSFLSIFLSNADAFPTCSVPQPLMTTSSCLKRLLILATFSVYHGVTLTSTSSNFTWLARLHMCQRGWRPRGHHLQPRRPGPGRRRDGVAVGHDG